MSCCGYVFMGSIFFFIWTTEAFRMPFFKLPSQIPRKSIKESVDLKKHQYNQPKKHKFKFYNSLTHMKQLFRPQIYPYVSFYSCGPTIYDSPHIGNLRAFLCYDILKRWLLFLGFEVKHVCNLTDIDDKIFERILKENVTHETLTSSNANIFFRDLKKLNIIPANKYPRASQHISTMIDMIKVLLDKKYAYVDNGNVLFDVKQDSNYDRFGRCCAQSHDNASYSVQKELKNFALWKAHKESDGDMKWEAPFGVGRPGWHIECSAMIKDYFNDTIDIHAGGTDLMFPHHENEMAQSEAANGAPLCGHWMHNNFVLVNGTKMSKSLGNFLTLEDLCHNSNSDERAFRYLVVTSHYRSSLNINADSIKAAKTALSKLDVCFEYVKRKEVSLKEIDDKIDSSTITQEAIDSFKQGFITAMNDDLNTPRAIAHVFGLAKMISKEISGETKIIYCKKDAQLLMEVFTMLDKVLGIFFNHPGSSTRGRNSTQKIPLEIVKLCKERELLKLSGDWKEADVVRDGIRSLGFSIQDQKSGGPTTIALEERE